MITSNENTRLWMAPLHGVTVSRFRNVFFRHFGGIDEVMAPFLPVVDAPTVRARQWKDILPQNNENQKITPQLMGNDPDQFVNTLHILADMGFTAANWNIGCPMQQIVRKIRGCGLMPHPDRVEQVVEAVCSRTTTRFSLKMRLGLWSPQEGLALLRRLEPYPLDFIVIHPRLGVQQYDGQPAWDAFDAMLAVTKHEVVYSGDVWSVADYQRLQQRYPTIRQWMLGRGLLQNPFLAEQIKSSEEIVDKQRFSAFYVDLLDSWHASGLTDKGILNSLKELWHYFAAFCQLPDTQLQQLLREDNLAVFEQKSRDAIL
ncbi:MAG: tRNA-dihydrouridine synthase family protein [Bacteroidales bacterium]|nr:tRNA-dihydrouridine synthase family protein [Bacteroidales bacterium]